MQLWRLLVFSGRPGPPTYTTYHPPTHNSEPRQTIEMFLDSLKHFTCLSGFCQVQLWRSQEQFYTITNQIVIEMISTDYIYTAAMAGIWNEK